MIRRQDQIRGCLLGAASGDALGCCVAELTSGEIAERYGSGGIQGYDTVNGYAAFSAQTQMLLYTANALLFGATRGATRGVMAPYVRYLDVFYREWATTQRYGSRSREVGRHYAWLTTLPELRCRRRPDTMTLYALDRTTLGTLAEPVNRSRSPAGLVRAVPIGLFLNPKETRPAEIRLLGAESAALTVGDPMGFLPAAYLTDMLNRIIYDRQDSFRSVLHASHLAMEQQFGASFPQLAAVRDQLLEAERLSEGPGSVQTNVERLRAMDAASCLAAACYVCLRFPGDFDRGLVAAVNQTGDSAAVGALVGAILGALVGTEGIPEFYLEPLELRWLVEEMADDLYQGCPMSRSARLFDDQWDQKYVQCTF